MNLLTNDQYTCLYKVHGCRAIALRYNVTSSHKLYMLDIDLYVLHFISCPCLHNITFHIYLHFTFIYIFIIGRKRLNNNFIKQYHCLHMYVPFGNHGLHMYVPFGNHGLHMYVPFGNHGLHILWLPLHLQAPTIYHAHRETRLFTQM